MDEETAKMLAEQLKHPSGELGLKIADSLVEGNVAIVGRAIATLAVEPGERIVEIGPANGLLSRAMVEELGTAGLYIGIESSRDMIEVATVNLAGASAKVKLVCADCMNVDVESESVHGVLAVNVIYFVDDFEALAKRIFAWLRPGGRVVFGVRSLPSTAQMPFVRYGFRMRSLDELMFTLSGCGFERIVASYEAEGTSQHEGEEHVVDSIVLCAKRP